MSPADDVPESEHPSIDESLRKLQRYGFPQSPTRSLEKMQEKLKEELEELQVEAAELNALVEEKLDEGEPDVFDTLKSKLQYLRGEIESRRNKQHRINNALQHDYMMEGMARLLGTRRRVAILEGVIFAMILFVLGLLFYDFSTPRTVAIFNLGEAGTFQVRDPQNPDLASMASTLHTSINQEQFTGTDVSTLIEQAWDPRPGAWKRLVASKPVLDGSHVKEFSIEAARPWYLTSQSIFWFDAICCIIFMTEFFMRRSCAVSKGWFWRNHWIDFFTSIPVPGEAQLARFGRVARVARFARVLRFTRVIRAMRVVLLLWRGMDKLQDAMDVKLMKRSLKWGLAVMLIGGVLVWMIEAGMAEEGNDVTTVGGGVWWSFTTVVTGGFGDIHNPLTNLGRLLTVLLVVTGMILVGVFTATLTSLYVGEESEAMQRHQDEMNDRLDRVEDVLVQMAEHAGLKVELPPEEEDS
jgi:voltage-gated potassium channel